MFINVLALNIHITVFMMFTHYLKFKLILIAANKKP